jgi:hypothetical protein
MPFYGNAIVAPTAFSRVKALVIDGGVVANSWVIRGTANTVPGGSYEFDIGNGQIRRISHTADITLNGTTAGPIINGRDQAAAFTNPSWVYLYAILDTASQSIIATIASANPPSVGPTMPSGWQSPIFIGAWRWISFPVTGRRRNDRFFFAQTNSNNIVDLASNLNTIQNTSAASVVPPTATIIHVSEGSDAVGTVVNGASNTTVTTLSFFFTNVSGSDVWWFSNVQNAVASVTVAIPFSAALPNDNGNINWLWGFAGTRAGGNTVIACAGYEESLT